MDTQHLGTRLRAIRAALRVAEHELVEHEEVCLHVYGSLGVISVIDVQGKKRETIASFGWTVKGSP